MSEHYLAVAVATGSLEQQAKFEQQGSVVEQSGVGGEA